MTQAGPGICDGLRKCLCGCGLRVVCATCPRRVECRLLLLRGPRLPMEQDGGNTTFVARVFIKLDARTRGE